VYHVSDAVELLLVFTTFFLTLAIMYFAQKWMDRDEGAADDED